MNARTVISMTIDDVEHLSPAQRAIIIASYPEHERDTRTKGIPRFGSGQVFSLPEERLIVEPFSIPKDWVQINGLDFGWDHPFAAVHCAWDRDADCFYVCHEFREKESTPVLHAAAVKPWGDWVPCAWPHDGLSHDKGSGRTLRDQYASQGLHMLLERATFPDGGFGLEAGVMEMLDMMKTDRWKVFKTCQDWLSEFRLYHRKEGLIVKVRDDLISASRYAMMMRRWARQGPRASSERRQYVKHWLS